MFLMYSTAAEGLSPDILCIFYTLPVCHIGLLKSCGSGDYDGFISNTYSHHTGPVFLIVCVLKEYLS